MTEKNNPTGQELADLAIICATLDELTERLRTRHASVSFGQVRVYDSNGDELGYLDNDADNHMIYTYRQDPA